MQSIDLFGFLRQPILTLSWKDVKQENFTWRFLRSLQLPSQELKLLQPDKNEWLQRGGVGIEDLKDMSVFPVNPLTDFAVDLAELWNMQCTQEEFTSMGITYDQLIQRGITPGIMSAFQLPLSTWVELGFNKDHAALLEEHETQLVFGLSHTELVKILCDFRPLTCNMETGKEILPNRMI